MSLLSIDLRRMSAADHRYRSICATLSSNHYLPDPGELTGFRNPNSLAAAIGEELGDCLQRGDCPHHEISQAYAKEQREAKQRNDLRGWRGVAVAGFFRPASSPRPRAAVDERRHAPRPPESGVRLAQADHRFRADASWSGASVAHHVTHHLVMSTLGPILHRQPTSTGCFTYSHGQGGTRISHLGPLARLILLSSVTRGQSSASANATYQAS